MGIRRWISGTLRPDKLETDSVNTEEAQIGKESYIRASRVSEVTNIASSTWKNIVDTKLADSRGEFDSNASFVPDKDGYYQIIGMALIVASRADVLGTRLYNVTDGTRVGGRLGTATAGSGGDNGTPFSSERFLTAGKKYQVQVTDFQSSFDLRVGDNGEYSNVTIKRSVVQP